MNGLEAGNGHDCPRARLVERVLEARGVEGDVHPNRQRILFDLHLGALLVRVAQERTPQPHVRLLRQVHQERSIEIEAVSHDQRRQILEVARRAGE